MPRGWAWSTIEDISNCILYGVSESAKSTGSYKLLRITDIQEGKVDWDKVPFTDFDENKAEKYLLNDGDILFARTGATVGKSYLTSEVLQAALFASYLIRVRYSNLMSPQYVKLFFESGYYWEQISSSSVGVGQPNVNGTSLGKLKIPIPPVAEQHRVAEEAYKLINNIDELDCYAEALNQDITATKSTIIDLAVHGKLVPQDPSDEPAIDLLKRINPDFVPSDNLHYKGDLPKGWIFCTIGDVFQHNTGKALNSVATNGQVLRYITTSNLYWDRFDLTDVRTMHFTEKELEKCKAVKGDLLVCEGGDIGRAAVWTSDESIMIQNHIHRLRPKTPVSVRYFYYVFYLYKRTGVIGGKGIAIPGLSSRELAKLVIPVPPVKEQFRIVDKIDNCFSILDEIVEQ